MDILKLTKPVKIDGEEKTEIPYDFDELNGTHIQAAIKELQQHSIVPGMVEIDTNYHAAIFAQAAGISFADVSRFKMKDYNKAVILARNFLIEQSEEDEQE